MRVDGVMVAGCFVCIISVMVALANDGVNADLGASAFMGWLTAAMAHWRLFNRSFDEHSIRSVPKTTE